MSRVLADTNILVYAVQKEAEKKHEIAAELLSDLVERRELAVSVQNLVEFSRVLLEKANPAPDSEDVKRYLFGFIKLGIVLRYTEMTVIQALSISKMYKIHFFDALLAATMEENGIGEIITENAEDFSRIPWLKVREPFKRA